MEAEHNTGASSSAQHTRASAPLALPDVSAPPQTRASAPQAQMGASAPQPQMGASAPHYLGDNYLKPPPYIIEAPREEHLGPTVRFGDNDASSDVASVQSEVSDSDPAVEYRGVRILDGRRTRIARRQCSQNAICYCIEALGTHGERGGVFSRTRSVLSERRDAESPAMLLCALDCHLCRQKVERRLPRTR
jgi:hypothetical protein